MKALVLVISLATLSSGQAVAGKGLSLLKQLATPSSDFYVPRLSRYLIAGGIGVSIVSVAGAFLYPEHSSLFAMTSLTGALSAASGAFWGFYRWDKVGQAREQERYLGTEVLYLDDNGDLQRGEVTSATLGGAKLLIEGQAPTDDHINFKISFLRNYHPDTYRWVEVLADNAERHLGYVFDVLDDGFYELKLLAEVDPAVDSSQHHIHHVTIEPYQIIINENVPLEEGGFRFTRPPVANQGRQDWSGGSGEVTPR